MELRSIEQRLAALCDKQELLELNLRYCRAVDRCDLDLLLSCFHDDAIDDHGTFKGSPADVFPGILDRMRTMPPAQHILDNALFTLDGDIAWGELYMSVRLSDADAGSLPDSFGRNLDRYERRDGEWRIAERRVIIERFFPDRDVDRTKFLTGRKDRQDPSYQMRQ
ncbi:nuclear transport factor 2 family protein [Sphingopyxis sp. GW247-27LB]|uniref:nuclear transport factor 2 family protein n=1 Tax=Sphingopyxis sp. GW247-27LB TaxID=2012632 RepID=UPI000BA58C5A|nr:nuclear transport factor 2 family protein [Sphingopyxis sp. GW247-27LB]PAL21487.1 gamma-BHC dehydrochlorinase [Sphingopyxis sp. GW247-27LB]